MNLLNPPLRLPTSMNAKELLRIHQFSQRVTKPFEILHLETCTRLGISDNDKSINTALFQVIQSPGVNLACNPTTSLLKSSKSNDDYTMLEKSMQN